MLRRSELLQQQQADEEWRRGEAREGDLLITMMMVVINVDGHDDDECQPEQEGCKPGAIGSERDRGEI